MEYTIIDRYSDIINDVAKYEHIKNMNVSDKVEVIKKLLNKYKFELDILPLDFDGIYIYSMIEYGITKEKKYLQLLQYENIVKIFRRDYENKNPSLSNDDLRHSISNEIYKSLNMDELEFVREIAIFSAVFNEIVNYRNIYTLPDYQQIDIHLKIIEVLSAFDKLLDLKEIWDKHAHFIKSYPSTRFGVVPRPLRVFISSKMEALRDVRELVNKALDDIGIDSWIYEVEAGARPSSVYDTSLQEVKDADIFLGFFWKELGILTKREFEYARELKKPCFIYIRDRNQEREQNLENFLKNEIKDPLKGVTYDYFDSLIPLCIQVANDIMKWLVNSYRELSAEIQEARISQTEINRRRDTIDRLQGASRERLPQGTPTDFLAYQTRDWFKTLGYKFEDYEKRDDDYFEWIINIPTRRGYDRVLIHGIRGEAEISDVTSTLESVNEKTIDEGWLIVARRKSQAALEELDKYKRKLYCYTFDELLDEVADFSGYLQWLENEVKRRKIDVSYVHQACFKEEFHPTTKQKIGLSRYDRRNGWVDGYIDRWLDDPSKEHISILGEFGTGKTWFTLYYAWKQAQKYLEAKESGVERPRLPLVIPLRDYAKAISVESLFSEFFFRKHEIPLPGYSTFEKLNRMGRLLLIFDGFDEMAVKVDRQKMINNFWDLAKVVVPGSKAILTCRTEHFPEAREGRALLGANLKASIENLTGEPPQFEVLELEKFDEIQIRKVLSQRADPEIVTSIMNNPSLMDLARRPVMTDFILEALPDIAEGKPVDLSRVYLYAVKRKMERDIKEERTFTSLADKLFFLCETSWEMLSNDKLSLNYREFPEKLHRLFHYITKEEKDLDYWQYDMMAQTMLIRNEDGDYTPAHRSLLEFFVAYKFGAELGLLSDDFTNLARAQTHVDEDHDLIDQSWSKYFKRDISESGEVLDIKPLKLFCSEPIQNLRTTFGKQPLTKAILDLISNMLDSDNIHDKLSAIIKQTKEKTQKEVGLIGGNSATLLLRFNVESLKNNDYSGSNLEHADFTNADLTNCVLKGAKLNNAIFKNTNLRNTNMVEADLNDCMFSKMGAIISIVYSPDGNKIAISGDSGDIYLFDTNTCHEIATLQGHSGKVNKIVWRPDGYQIASVSDDYSIRLWDVVNNYTSVELKQHNAEVTSLCYNPDGQYLVSGGLDGKIILWDSHNYTIITEKEYNGHIYGISYNYDGSLIANRINRTIINIWDPIKGLDMKRISGTTDYTFKKMAFHPTKNHLAFTIGYRYFLIMDIDNANLNLANAREINRNDWHHANITDITFNSEGNLIATCSMDKTIRLFSYPELKCLTVLKGHTNSINSISFHHFGNILASGSSDSTIRIWDCAPEILSEKDQEYRANENFGQCIKIISHTLECEKLKISRAQGLDVIKQNGDMTLKRWLISLGAIS